jgi:hypothetical protein
MVFLPQDAAQAAKSKEILEASIVAEGLTVLGWRDVPVDKAVVGRMAKATEPGIQQVLVNGATGDELERKLYVARKTAEGAAAAADAAMPGIAENFYVCTLSSRTIVYKGMLRSVVVGQFFEDLRDPDFVAQFCIYHRRFSTNTVPKWPLAQPMRFLGHNGEINTLQGNLNWMASKEADMTHPVWEGREAELRPICNPAASDSANLDRVAELLVQSGRPVAETMMLLVPEVGFADTILGRYHTGRYQILPDTILPDTSLIDTLLSYTTCVHYLTLYCPIPACPTPDWPIPVWQHHTGQHRLQSLPFRRHHTVNATVCVLCFRFQTVDTRLSTRHCPEPAPRTRAFMSFSRACAATLNPQRSTLHFQW